MSENDQHARRTYRVRIWKGRNPDGDDYAGEPDEILEIPESTVWVWQDDPYYHSPPLGLDIHPDDGPATLNVYSSDSVHPVHDEGDNYVDTDYWDGPMEQGLTYEEGHDYPPFGCEVWDRVMFYVEEGAER